VNQKTVVPVEHYTPLIRVLEIRWYLVKTDVVVPQLVDATVKSVHLRIVPLTHLVVVKEMDISQLIVPSQMNVELIQRGLVTVQLLIVPI
jgi:hypothetical protein